jgi:tetratricopeptide (TPR) repeat protein
LDLIEVSLSQAVQAFREGRAAQAESQLRQLVLQAPKHPEVRFSLGLVLGRGGRWAEAEEQFGEVVSAQPNRTEALFWMALTKKHQGRANEAAELCERAVAVDPNNAVLWNELGLCRLTMNQAELAATAFGRALRRDPLKGVYRYNHGLALTRLDLIYKAKEAFEEAIRLEPTRVESYLELARILETLGQRDEAVAMLQRAVKRHPADLQLQTTLAAAHAYRGDSEKAEEIYRRAMEADPAYGHAMGPWMQQEGRFAESVACFETSIRAMPSQGLSYFGLAEAKVFEIDGESIIDRLVPLVDSDELDLKGRVYALYALAKAYERQGDWEMTIRTFDRANESAYRLHNEGRPFDRPLLREITDQAMARYSAEELKTRWPGASESDCPIFIVGMIRSGTTLLDQVISNHPIVKSAGEPVYWMREADKVRRLKEPRLSPKQVAELTSNYLAAIEAVAGNAERITDKMPLNYAHVGLIHQVFPKAKIIHMRRNPLDTCLSIYTTFLGQGPNFGYNQSNIVFNYREYLRIMEHWRRALPSESFLEVDYEDLTADKEPMARRIIEFCGLAWDDQCLSHERNESAIRTPSKWQARQPMYRSSVERWRRYEPWLGEILKLRDLLPKGD